MSRTTVRLLRVGGSVALLAVVILMLPRGELVAALRQASLAVLAPTVVAYVLCHVAAAYKWRMLMAPSTHLAWGTAVRAHFTGLVGNLSPLGMIGGDLARAGVAMKGASHSSAIVLTSIVDRIVDTAALLVLATVGFAWIGARSATAGMVLIGGLVVAAGGVVAVLVGHALLRRTQNARFAGIRGALDVLLEHPGLIVRALLLSLMIQGSLITISAGIGASVGVESPFAAWLFAWPAAKLAGYLPIGFAGFGVRETALVALMAPLGGAAGPVLAAGLLWDAVLIVGGVGGWLLLCAARPAPAPTLPAVTKTEVQKT